MTRGGSEARGGGRALEEGRGGRGEGSLALAAASGRGGRPSNLANWSSVGEDLAKRRLNVRQFDQTLVFTCIYMYLLYVTISYSSNFHQIGKRG